MYALLTTVFVASLLGSLHCVGMCGPFALLAGTGDGRRFRAAPTVAYSLGRLTSYTVVGALFGGLGLALNHGVPYGSWQQTGTLVAGMLMLAVGTIALARQCGVIVKLPRMAGPLEKSLGAVIRFGRSLTPIRRAALIGLASSLMPCGWLYVFALAAASTASPVWGGLVMAVFWAGTVPIMAALGLGWGRLSGKFQAKVPIIMAMMVILIGVFTMVQRSPIDWNAVVVRDQVVHADDRPSSNAFEGSTPATLVAPATPAEAIRQIQSLDHDQLPCCQGKNAASEAIATGTPD
ncbi:MAG: sulfite exporter TauE/SafE family protein [Planctomycetaceae bacterium]|nr:sulfite exporter TauE/SafE family protein [Planctomycetaceae bacterium]